MVLASAFAGLTLQPPNMDQQEALFTPPARTHVRPSRRVAPSGSSGTGKLARVPFTFADLFAGIGGFHAALSALQGEAWFASEIDRQARLVYERNWRTPVDGDIVQLTEGRMAVPPHDVLAAGFPCQPFSKSGYQRGMSETRGTLFWNICRVLEERRPTVLLLENVRNLAGPRHRDTTWRTIVACLRDLGYRVSDTPAVFSPHLLPPHLAGRPQVRERGFITATYVGRDRAWRETATPPIVSPRPVDGWDPAEWDLAKHLPLQDDDEIDDLSRYRLSDAETEWIDAWDELISLIRADLKDDRLPGFPIWADEFVHPKDLVIPAGTPAWKANFLKKNAEFYARHQRAIESWLPRVQHFPPSRRKLEWQAQEPSSLWETVMHFRPSGIRAKRPTYLPALVAITQTSIIGERLRRITPREAARLQGLPDWFEFGAQNDAATYRQLGNGVNVGVAYHVFREHVLRDRDDIGDRVPDLVESVEASDPCVDNLLDALQPGPLPVTTESGSRGTESQWLRPPERHLVAH
jgi:DNA (cytosine-5)-methyltransferase 1